MFALPPFAMALNATDIQKLGRLARLHVPEDRRTPLAAEVSGIMGWIEQLSAVPVEGIAPMAASAFTALPLREDALTDGGYPSAILANAPDKLQGFFAVPKVVE
jgi:aspartyl-tRNA(Asn)/glutamyl-tRNA(Gln) amidotransferase subunit C